MVLQPLEFSECYLDSPSFRERIRAHEAELERTNRFIKELYKDGKNLISATKQLGLAQRKFAQCLGEFQFEYIGDARTDDEKCIASVIGLWRFLALFIQMRNITETLMKPLEKFRKEQLGAAKEERKRYEKETEKYYSALEKLLTLSAKKKEQHLQEADLQVELMRQHFQEESLEYVCKLQEIQERKKFDCVEPMLAFFQTVFTFYHQGYELAKDFDHYKRALQINIQNTRSRFEGTRSEVVELMKKIKECPQQHRQTSPISIEGYLYVQEKRPPPFGSSWVKRYCTFVKEQKILHMVTFDQRSGGKIGETESVTFKSCVRKTTDVLDRRFCLDLEITDRPGAMLTVQTLSEEDRKLWMEAMGGTEPVSLRVRTRTSSLLDAQLNEIGISFVKNCINAIEKRGINDQGLYRVVGVSSKVQKLLNIMTDEKSGNEVDLSASDDWDVKTITSALKLFLRSGRPREPCAALSPRRFSTFTLGQECRVQVIHGLVHRLPETNRLVLGLLVKHLARVAANSKQNLMTVANLGVVFGPTLMRPQEETVAAIMELKFQNIVVEILIENHQKVCGTAARHPPSVLTPVEESVNGDVKHGDRLGYHITLQPAASCQMQRHSSKQPAGPAWRPRGPPPRPHWWEPEARPGALPPDWPGQTAPLADHSDRTRSRVLPTRLVNTFKKLGCYDGSGNVPAECLSVTNRKAKAVYPCEAEHDSELSFDVGAIFDDVIFSREPGWLEGELEGRRGLIPENYVEML
uniref:Rho GTPase activating protein 10 n=1 Tax=Scleropages formosus TaxID=113540 RepID=A0A8C9T7A9_SCLFO